MSEPLVTVMREQKIAGWPDEEGRTARDVDRAYVLPLSKALTRQYTTDAHFAQYCTPNGRRLRMAAAETTISVQMPIIVLDVDCKETHGTSEPTPTSWRADTRQKMLALRSAHPSLFFYETKGGLRVIYRQPVPFLIECAADALEWKRDYAITCAYLKRVFDIEADVACADWTRLFRLPHATRKPGSPPESWPTAGDPARIEALWFEPEDEDRELAKTLLPRAFEEPRQEQSFTPYTGGDGYGVLYHLLRNRGHIVRPFGRGGYVIRCPNHEQHSSGRIGDRSTVLYLPQHGQTLGKLHCLHGHCQHQSPSDWLRMFADHEITAAREAAGLPVRRTA
jgi:hypothetical protein